MGGYGNLMSFGNFRLQKNQLLNLMDSLNFWENVSDQQESG